MQPTYIDPFHADLDFVLVEKGRFMMGGADEMAYPDEKPLHYVNVATFYMCRFEATQALWEAVMGHNPARFKGARRPVETISWLEVGDFVQKLNTATEKNRHASGLGAYRLPTEAEWEYAARGGKAKSPFIYAGSPKLKEVGWYDENSNNQTHQVGQKHPNELGLYDMSGNVWEWVDDHWHRNFEDAPDNSITWMTGDYRTKRVIRGGSLMDKKQFCRVSIRRKFAPVSRDVNIGFRLALSPTP